MMLMSTTDGTGISSNRSAVGTFKDTINSLRPVRRKMLIMLIILAVAWPQIFGHKKIISGIVIQKFRFRATHPTTYNPLSDNIPRPTDTAIFVLTPLVYADCFSFFLPSGKVGLT
jgi:hypothetical protein